MLVLGGSSEYMQLPLTGPYADLTAFPGIWVALIPVTTAAEPADADYKQAQWLDGELSYKPAGKWQDSYPVGEYLVYPRIVAAPEDVRLPACGRIRIGDVR